MSFINYLKEGITLSNIRKPKIGSKIVGGKLSCITNLKIGMTTNKVNIVFLVLL